jgi:mannose/fructose-specific phosphotransferase system component IIA
MRGMKKLVDFLGGTVPAYASGVVRNQPGCELVAFTRAGYAIKRATAAAAPGMARFATCTEQYSAVQYSGKQVDYVRCVQSRQPMAGSDKTINIDRVGEALLYIPKIGTVL